MTTIFPPLCFNFNMPNLRRRLDPSAPPVSTEAAERVIRTPVRVNRRICKNLFGDSDHEENLKCFKKYFDEVAEADARRWNFDFINEKPLEGGIKWQATDKSKVPPAYSMPNLTAKIMQPVAGPSTPSEESTEEKSTDRLQIEAADITATTTHIVKPVCQTVTSTENNTKSTIKTKIIKRKRSQTHITDYLRSCKRTRSSESTKVEDGSSQPILKRAKTS